jgi:ATP-dependent RNA helicase RhlE
VSGFDTLGLPDTLVQATQACGFTTPTPVQAEAIPQALTGRDVLATAQTGSGKTLAFVLSILAQLDSLPRRTPRHTHALILVPTRELAMQVNDTLLALAPGLSEPIRWACVFGGVSINPQMMALRGGAEIVVATPGRLLDLVEHNALHLNKVATLVLDEADRLLDAGFADELSRVLALLPAKRQHLFFSATFPPAVQALAQGLLHDAVRIEVPHTEAEAPDIEQHAIEVDAAQRTPLLRHLIAQEGWRQVLVFVATRYACDHVADKLRRNGIDAAAFHADASQRARSETLAAFKAGTLQVLVATDLAARGIDIAQLPAVVNYDLPRAAVDYVHRIGRTARAGASGVAVSFVTADTAAHFRLIEKRQGQRVPREHVPGFEPTPTVEPSSATQDDGGTGGIKGRRKSKKDKLREAAARGS